jgi:hypothetical protein
MLALHARHPEPAQGRRARGRSGSTQGRIRA